MTETTIKIVCISFLQLYEINLKYHDFQTGSPILILSKWKLINIITKINKVFINSHLFVLNEYILYLVLNFVILDFWYELKTLFKKKKWQIASYPVIIIDDHYPG